MAARHVHRGERRLDDPALGDIVKPDHRDVLWNPVTAEHQSLHRTDGNDVVVGKIAFCKGILPVDRLKHIRHGGFDGRGEPVNDGTGWRHSVLF